jgi:carbon storage regulator CsrA
MLVISRRPEERIVLPTLGVTLQILRVQKNVVRVGIDAPPEVRVLREELLDKPLADTPARPQAKSPGNGLSHALRNRLNKATLALHLLQRQLESDRVGAAMLTLEQVIAALEGLEAPPAPKTPKRCRTLVVEDERNERELLAGLLNMHGCECVTAADGAEALAYLDNNARPDFVLLDMRMPRCDGPQTLAQIRRDPRFVGLKVFAISGTTPEDAGLKVGPQGVDAWFQKPLNPRQLWEVMQQCLNRPAPN